METTIAIAGFELKIRLDTEMSTALDIIRI